jgi:hypothetical protein
MLSTLIGHFSSIGMSWHAPCKTFFEPIKSSLTNATFRRFIMLTIKDLSQAQELDAAAMSAVRGGNGYRYVADEYCGTPVPKHIPGSIPGFPFPHPVVPEVQGIVVQTL